MKGRTKKRKGEQTRSAKAVRRVAGTSERERDGRKKFRNVRDLSLGLSRVSSVTLDLGDEVETGGNLSEDGLSEGERKGKKRRKSAFDSWSREEEWTMKREGRLTCFPSGEEKREKGGRLARARGATKEGGNERGRTQPRG